MWHHNSQIGTISDPRVEGEWVRQVLRRMEYVRKITAAAAGTDCLVSWGSLGPGESETRVLNA